MSANRDPLAGKRLDSWKEIAAFFGRAERTVKRWETERGLPVHRLPGSGRSSVFAYSDELADWLKGRSQELEAEEATGQAAEAKEAEERKDESGAREGGSAAVAVRAVESVSAPDNFLSALRNFGTARLAAWIIPLLLAAALIAYFSAGHSEAPPFKALASRHSANSESLGPSLGPDSVAVLPFTNERGDTSTDYLSDGITESLIGNLAHVPRLKVRSRDSVFRYKGKDVDVPTIGSNLGVSAVVSGRVVMQGDSIVISTELTNVRDNTEIWGHRYTGKASRLISLQQQMAGDIAGALRSTLSAADRQQVINQGTRDAKAYSLYLKGRYLWNKRTLANLQTSVSYFNQAITEDPEYALAYSGLADAYSAMSNFGGNPNEDFPKSNAAARKALELDPTLAHPHAVLGSNEMGYDWDFAGGEAEFKKAMELDPDDATAHQWYAEELSAIGGREQEALAEINRAHRLDPQSPIISRVIGSVNVWARRYDEAIAVCKELKSQDPTFTLSYDCLGYAYWGKRMYPQLIAEWITYAQLTHNPDDAELAAALDRGFRSAGWKGSLTQAIETLQNRRKTRYSSPFMIARFYADLGDKEQAFQWLDTAYREHDFLLNGLRTEFQFDILRSDPRFAELVSKIGLPKVQ